MPAAWDAGEPWWCRSAITYLAHILPTNGGTAFEWGAGGSTVWLAARGLAVTTIESDPGWAAKVKTRCPTVNVRLRTSLTGYVAAAELVPPGSLDVAVIDGLDRPGCARAIAAKIRPGGVVVLDDTNVGYFAVAGEAFTGWPAVTWSGTKPDSDGRWSTTFYTRPM